MEKENEIEYKSLIDQDKHNLLIKHFSDIAEKQNVYTQTNYYFDNEKRDLEHLKITLRLREKIGNWELTIKIPEDENKKELFSKSTEFNEALSEEEAKFILENGLNSKHVLIERILLNLYDIDKDTTFSLLGSLETKRQDFKFYDDIISLDKSKYNDVVDYELEWETTNHKFVKKELKMLDVTPGNAKGKRKRFLRTLKVSGEE